MIKRLFSLATLVLLAAACTDNIDSTFDGLRRLAQTGQDGTVFYATIEGSADSTATKVFADDQLRVLWNADDRITIFEKYTLGEEYRFEGKDGDNAGSFSPVSQGNGYVVGIEGNVVDDYLQECEVLLYNSAGNVVFAKSTEDKKLDLNVAVPVAGEYEVRLVARDKCGNVSELARVCDLSRTTAYKYIGLLEG